MQCRKCQSVDVWFTKHIHNGRKQGKSFHYKLHCRTCKTQYHIQRSKEVFELVKDTPWIVGKKRSQL